ncbi:MAG: hypothetical protein JXA66_01000 [Oligoflexia bacterium]|nr:hypothetical protein [Oligoflexia bacterium]
MKQTNGMVGNHKRICRNYSLISESIPERKTVDEVDKGFSVSFAAGLKLDFKEKSGFSVKILNPQEIAEEETRSKKAVTAVGKQGKGGSLNIYC